MSDIQKKYDEHEKQVLDSIEQKLNETNKLKIEREYPLNGFRFDGFIHTNDNKPIAIIEVKISLERNGRLNQIKEMMKQKLYAIYARFALITDGDKCLFYDKDCDEDFGEFISFDEAIKKITGKDDCKEKGINNTELLKRIKEFCSEPENSVLNDFAEFLNNATDIIKCKYGIYSFSADCENKFIDAVLPKPKPNRTNKICSYVSLDTFYQIINNKKIRMNCIVGMNDSSEINFVENYIYSKDSKDVSLVNFKDVNSTFIFCCSPIDSQKRLSMWRLYGNDAKGVCLEFEINLKKRCRFKICDIAYITFDNTNDAFSKGMVSVKVFDLLKSFIDWVSFGGKYKFRFNTLHDWAHFFKPEEYADEKEIRVLYKDRRKNNSKWTLRPDSRIFSPYIEFELNDINYPLKLKSVVLGPKCSEVKVNLNQIRDFMKSSGFIDVDVKESPIVTYR